MLLPQPTKNAKAIYDVITSVLAIAPPVAALKPFFDAYLNKQMRQAQDVLVQAVRERGIVALNDEQFEFYVPAVYRFLEQVRVGEYEHNLKVLAALITQRLTDADRKNLDVGAVARAAKRLDMMSFGELETLAVSKIAWDRLVLTGPTLQSAMYLQHDTLLDAHATVGISVSFPDLNERLHELDVRGILRYSPPSGFFHGGYTPTSAYFEIIDAVADSVRNAAGPSSSNGP